MCQIISHTVEVLDGTPPWRFVLLVRVGDRPEIVVDGGVGKELIVWQKAWGTYRPFATATLERAIAEFRRRRNLGAAIEVANAELAGEQRMPHAGTRRRGEQSSQDRQLPAGDRA